MSTDDQNLTYDAAKVRITSLSRPVLKESPHGADQSSPLLVNQTSSCAMDRRRKRDLCDFWDWSQDEGKSEWRTEEVVISYRSRLDDAMIPCDPWE